MRLQDWMDREGYTQASLARVIGVHKSTINKLFKGKSRSVKLAFAIEALTSGQVSLGEVLRAFEHSDNV